MEPKCAQQMQIISTTPRGKPTSMGMALTWVYVKQPGFVSQNRFEIVLHVNSPPVFRSYESF